MDIKLKCANPYLVTKYNFKTEMPESQYVIKSTTKHSNHETVTPISVKKSEWGKNGRALNRHAKKQLNTYFRRICREVADRCKTIVHSYNIFFYKSAKRQFDTLTSDPRYTIREDVNVSHGNEYKFGEKIINNYSKNGFSVAHYFLRVFRHNEYLNVAVLQYHGAWLKSKKGHLTLEVKNRLKLFLKDFLQVELKLYEKFQRLKCEKQILIKLTQDETIFEALHNTLLAMGGDVVLLSWCSEWKNEYLFLFNRNGPFRNLLTSKKSVISGKWTTPTFKVHGKNVQITDLFSLRTYNEIDNLEILDWVSLIRASYSFKLHEKLLWLETGENVNIKKIHKDIKFYKKLVLLSQKIFENTRFHDKTYQWEPIDHVSQKQILQKKKIKDVFDAKTTVLQMQISDLNPLKNFTTSIDRGKDDYGGDGPDGDDADGDDFDDNGQDDDGQDDDGQDDDGQDDDDFDDDDPDDDDPDDDEEGHGKGSNDDEPYFPSGDDLYAQRLGFDNIDALEAYAYAEGLSFDEACWRLEDELAGVGEDVDWDDELEMAAQARADAEFLEEYENGRYD